MTPTEHICLLTDTALYTAPVSAENLRDGWRAQINATTEPGLARALALDYLELVNWDDVHDLIANR